MFSFRRPKKRNGRPDYSSAERVAEGSLASSKLSIHGNPALPTGFSISVQIAQKGHHRPSPNGKDRFSVKRVAVIADHLVEHSEITMRLQSRGAEVALERLNDGEYRISGRCTISVLPAADFARLTSDRQLFRRITELKKSVSNPVVIVQGELPTNGNGPSRAASQGALAFLAVHNRVPVLFAKNEGEAADLIYAMGNQAQNGMGESLTAKTVAITDTPNSPPQTIEIAGDNRNGDGSDEVIDISEQIVRLLPDIGPATAKALLKRFGNLRGVFSASSRDLNTVDGIGPKKAKQLAAFFGEHIKSSHKQQRILQPRRQAKYRGSRV